LQRYADFLAYLSRSQGLREFAPDAAAAVAEQGARRAGRRDRLTTRVSDIADLAREASYACARNGDGPVLRAHVREAALAMQRRHDLVRELTERDLQDGYLLVRTTGRSVGQVNCLTVMDTGTFVFGKPSRITASTGIGARGRSRLVNIERESELSGPLHDKGVLILNGFLLDRFAQDGTLRLEATLCLEQNYGGVDGDSAASAELYAILSSLAKVPLAQGIGVTGSVNQKGEIQAVSAVNEKIEGFFRLCRANGFAGGQGALIPRANVPDLMLDDEVVDAVRAGQFSVWAIDRIEDGLRLLAGMSADEVMGRAATTLARFREQAR
jgi:predicted ATP-dependent protease